MFEFVMDLGANLTIMFDLLNRHCLGVGFCWRWERIAFEESSQGDELTCSG